MKREVKLRPLTSEERYRLVFEYQWTIYDKEGGKEILALPWADGWAPGLSSEEQAERSVVVGLVRGAYIEARIRTRVLDVGKMDEEIRREVIRTAKKGGGKRGGKGKGC